MLQPMWAATQGRGKVLLVVVAWHYEEWSKGRIATQRQARMDSPLKKCPGVRSVKSKGSCESVVGGLELSASFI